MAPDIASDVQVIATFYYSSNKVVGTNNSLTTPRNIASGEKAHFDLMMSSASIPIEEINHYELKVDWRVKQPNYCCDQQQAAYDRATCDKYEQTYYTNFFRITD